MDVGGGASLLVDRLLAEGFSRLTVVDVSDAALAVAKARLGDRAANVSWVVRDARTLRLEQPVGFWHDRAVFHFMTTPADQEAYLASLRRAVTQGGHVLIATFAPGGPDKCSGLAVQRYDPGGLARRIGPEFQLLRAVERVHRTPWGSAQPFTYALFRRVAGP